MIAPAKLIGYGRAMFDRGRQLRVQRKEQRLDHSLGNRAMIRLTSTLERGRLRGFFRDMKVCHITGSRAVRGSVIHRRGLAKKKGGVGRHITKMVPRIFAPNLRRQRIWVPELKKFVRVRVTARGLKTINKQGAYKALKKVGAI
jgi:large subunit ribosomal protein L28